jgi:hypothetical protein
MNAPFTANDVLVLQKRASKTPHVLDRAVTTPYHVVHNCVVNIATPGKGSCGRNERWR